MKSKKGRFEFVENLTEIETLKNLKFSVRSIYFQLQEQKKIKIQYRQFLRYYKQYFPENNEPEELKFTKEKLENEEKNITQGGVKVFSVGGKKNHEHNPNPEDDFFN